MMGNIIIEYQNTLLSSSRPLEKKKKIISRLISISVIQKELDNTL